MKKVFAVVLLLVIGAAFLSAEDILVGLSYFTDSYDGMYTGDNYDSEDLDFPFLSLVELDAEAGSAYLYYTLYGENHVEYVELSDYSSGEEYSSFRQYVFYSEIVGNISFCMGDKVTADDLGAAMGTYTFFSNTEDKGITAVMVAATADLQDDEDASENLQEFIDDIKDNFENSGY